jgi:hypothetical protein
VIRLKLFSLRIKLHHRIILDHGNFFRVLSEPLPLLIGNSCSTNDNSHLATATIKALQPWDKSNNFRLLWGSMDGCSKHQGLKTQRWLGFYLEVSTQEAMRQEQASHSRSG